MDLLRKWKLANRGLVYNFHYSTLIDIVKLNKTCQHNSTLNDIGTKQNAFLFNIYFINQSKTRDICLQKKKNSTRQLITRNNEKNLKKHYEYKEI